ncbi:hypothetical protein Hanom_Chr07g00677501 [Helianthus anomalus]
MCKRSRGSATVLIFFVGCFFFVCLPFWHETQTSSRWKFLRGTPFTNSFDTK